MKTKQAGSKCEMQILSSRECEINSQIYEKILSRSRSAVEKVSNKIQPSRGRIPLATPKKHHVEVLAATRRQTYEEIAAKYKVSKQRIGQIVRRWKHLLPVRRLRQPNVPDDFIIHGIAKKKENRVHIVSFRLTEAEVELLRKQYPNAKSVDRAARDIVSKFLTI